MSLCGEKEEKEIFPELKKQEGTLPQSATGGRQRKQKKTESNPAANRSTDKKKNPIHVSQR